MPGPDTAMSSVPFGASRLPRSSYDRNLLGHGWGGLLKSALIQRLFVPTVGSEILDSLNVRAAVCLSVRGGAASPWLALPTLGFRSSGRVLLRLWGLVWVANIFGAIAFARMVTRIGTSLGMQEPRAFGAIVRRMTDVTAPTICPSGILSGRLMGRLSWLMTAGHDTISEIVVVRLVDNVDRVRQPAPCNPRGRRGLRQRLISPGCGAGRRPLPALGHARPHRRGGRLRRVAQVQPCLTGSPEVLERFSHECMPASRGRLAHKIGGTAAPGCDPRRNPLEREPAPILLTGKEP